MAGAQAARRIDKASRVIGTTPEALYRAFLDPQSWLAWLPPAGMTVGIERFEPWEGGRYRLVLTYAGAAHTPGKASEHSDVVEARFLELVPNERVVHRVEFPSDDPAYAGAMRMTWSLARVPGGTEVTIACEDVPAGISPEDHAVGLASTLANLAALMETKS